MQIESTDSEALADAGSQQREPAQTEDQDYALVSVLCHALQGVQASEQYIDDAELAGDTELVQVFTESRDEQASRANQAKGLLMARIDEESDEDEETEESSEDEDE